MNRKIKCLLFCIFTFFLFSLNCYANDYEITSYDVDIVVDKYNKLSVIEKIDTYFDFSKHGIIRRMPLHNKIVRQDGSYEKNRVLISNVKVSEDFSTSKEYDNYVLKIGSADSTIIGNHSYIISYDYDIGLDKNNNFDELYFNIIGTEWDTSISNVTFKITMPKEFDASKLGFSHGSYGESYTDDISYDVEGNVITGSFNGTLYDGEGLNVRMELPQGYFERRKINFANLGFYIIPILSVLVSYLLWNKYGKDDQVVDVVSFYPPEDMNSLDIAFAKKGSVNSNDVVSLMVYLASKGYIKIIEDEKSKKKFSIQKVKEYDGDNNEERLFFNGLFRSRSTDLISFLEYMDAKGKIKLQKDENKINVQNIDKDGNVKEVSLDNTNNKKIVTSKELEDSFYTTINSILYSKNKSSNRKVYYSSKSSGKRLLLFFLMFISLCLSTIIPAIGYKFSDMYFPVVIISFVGTIILILFSIIYDNNYSKKGLVSSLISSGIYLLLFSIFSLAIISVEYVFYDTIYLVGFIICIICTYLINLFYLIMSKRTEYGTKILGEINGFKNFLETAEKDKLESLVNDDPAYFYNILPYAYVLGVSDKWIKQFEGITLAPPEWYESSTVFDYYRFNSSLNRTLTSANRVMNSRPQSSGDFGSSGGGFSGGGFSGGGSGGGGGSSW